MEGFFPPVLIEIQVAADAAIAKLHGVNDELGTMDKQATLAGASLSKMEVTSKAATGVLLGIGAAAVAFGALSVKSAMDSQVAFSRLDTAMRNAGLGSQVNLEAAKALAEQNVSLGFTVDSTANAYGTLVTVTNNTSDATHLLNLSMDLARYKHISLEEAATTLARGTQGSAKAFKEMGITLDTTLPKQEAINRAFDQLQQKLSGQNAAYLDTFQGKLSVMGAEFKKLEDNVGGALIPVLTDAMTFLQHYGADILVFVGIVGGAALAVKAYEATQTALLAVNALLGISLAAQIANEELLVAQTAILSANTGVLTEAEAALMASTEGATGAMAAMSAVMDANPIGAMVLAVTALVAAFIALDKIWRALTSAPSAGDNAYLNSRLGKPDNTLAYGQTKTTGGRGGSTTAYWDVQKQEWTTTKPSFISPEQQNQSPIDGGTTTEPFALTGYTGAQTLTAAQKAAQAAQKALSKAHLAELTKDQKEVQTIYGQMNTVILDDSKQVSSAKQAMINSDLSAQKSYGDAVTNLTKNEASQEVAIHKSASDQIIAIKASEAANILNLQQQERDQEIALREAAAKQQNSIIAQSMALLTNAFESATKIDLGKMFVDSGNNLSTVVDNMRTQLKAATDLAKNEAALAAKGYSQEFITQLMSQGADTGNALATQILSGAAGSGDIKALFDQLQQTSGHGNDALASSLYSQNGLANDQLKAQSTQVAQDLATSLADAQVALEMAMMKEHATASAAIDKVMADEKTQISDAQTALTQALSDANDTMQSAFKDAYQTYQTQVTAINDDTTAKLDALNTKLKATADLITALAGKSAGVGAMAGSPVAGLNAGITSLQSNGNGGLEGGGNNSENSGHQTIINQDITVTTPQDVAQTTYDAMVYGRALAGKGG